MVPAGARASPHWTPHAQANAKSNPAQSSKLRAAHFAALKEWEPTAHPGPLEYAACSAIGHSPAPPGFGRSGSRQRPEPRVRAHPTGRTIGPGSYDRIGFGTFSRYEATRQELWRTDRPTARKVSHSHPQGRPTSTRARDDQGDPPHLASPGPGQYNLERYSQVRSPTHPLTRTLQPCASNHYGRRKAADGATLRLTRACTRPLAVCRGQLVQPVRAERPAGDVELRHEPPLGHHDDARRSELHDPVRRRADARDQPVRRPAAPRSYHALLATQPCWPLRAARPRQVALPPLGAEPPPDALGHRCALTGQVTPTRPHRTLQPTQARNRCVRGEAVSHDDGIAASVNTWAWSASDRPPPPPPVYHSSLLRL